MNSPHEAVVFLVGYVLVAKLFYHMGVEQGRREERRNQRYRVMRFPQGRGE